MFSHVSGGSTSETSFLSLDQPSWSSTSTCCHFYFYGTCACLSLVPTTICAWGKGSLHAQCKNLSLTLPWPVGGAGQNFCDSAVPEAVHFPCPWGLRACCGSSAISRLVLCFSWAQPPLPLEGGGALQFTVSTNVPATSGLGSCVWLRGWATGQSSAVISHVSGL